MPTDPICSSTYKVQNADSSGNKEKTAFAQT